MADSPLATRGAAACDVRFAPHDSSDGGDVVGIPAVRVDSRPARRSEFLPFAPPLIGEEEIAEVVDTLRSSWITTGPKTRQFETDFAAYLQAPGALAVSSCTAALHTALVSARVGPGDEVITTPMTFAASRSEEHTSELQSPCNLV